MSNTSRSAHAGSSLSQLGWAIADGWTIARRDIAHWRLQPFPVIIGWVFPIMIVLMFVGLFGGAMSVSDGISYLEFLMPGMLTMTMLFGLETTMLAVTTDAAKGVTDRFRSLPIGSSAVVLGRCLADMLNSLVALLAMLVTGLLLGWRWHGGLGAGLAALGLLVFLRFALLWLGIYIGLIAKGPESVAAVQILVWPVGFLSNVFVDPATMPAWLGTLALWNPLSATTTAVRQLFGTGGTGGSWVAQHSILMALVWPALLIAIFLPLSVRAFRNLRS